MAKRFIDTNLFRKRWIRQLDTDMKLFWIYILTDCDHAGIWDVDIDRAAFQLNMKLDENKILNTFKNKIFLFKKDKWFIPKYIEYQYGELNPAVNAHKSAIKILQKYNLIDGNQLLINSSLTVKDKDKDKVKDKVKVKVKKKKTKQEQLKEIEDNLEDLKNEFSSQDVYFEFDKFKDYLLAHGKRYSQYNAAFKNWLRGNEKRNKVEAYDDLLK